MLTLEPFKTLANDGVSARLAKARPKDKPPSLNTDLHRTRRLMSRFSV